MELVAGETLAELIDAHDDKDSHIPVERVLLLLRQIAEGLDAVHAAELVHRDVKPDNVILEEKTGRPVLVDFGLALRNAQSGEMMVAGTPSYMAPEQLLGQRPTPASDAYSLACTAFEMLTNRTPFCAPSTVETFKMHTCAAPPPLSQWRPELPAGDEVFRRALAKGPAERYPSCGAFVAALEAALSRPRWSTTGPESAKKVDERALVLIADDDAAFVKLCARALGIALFGLPAKVEVVPRAGLLARARERLPRLVLVGGGGAMETHQMLGELMTLPGEQPRIAAIEDPQRPVSRVESLRVADVVRRTTDFPQLLQVLQGIVVRCGFERSAAPPRSRR